jgi:hypothetical protein
MISISEGFAAACTIIQHQIPYCPPLLDPVLTSVQFLQVGVGMVGRCAAWTGTLPPP